MPTASPARVPSHWVLAKQLPCGASRLHHYRLNGDLVERTHYLAVPTPGSGRGDKFKYDPDRVNHLLQRDEARRRDRAQSRHPNVKDRPPADGIRIKAAVRKYHVAPETIWSLVDEGKLSAGLGLKPGSRGQRPTMVSSRILKRLTAGHKPTRPRAERMPSAPLDGEPIGALAREFGIALTALTKWCEWKVHPGLGRRIRFGVGPYKLVTTDGRSRFWRGRLVSRADVAELSGMAENPTLRRIARNPGIWLSADVFKNDDGQVYFTEPYISRHREQFGLPPRYAYAARLDCLVVVWPAAEPKDRWVRKVYSQASLERLAERRAGKADGGAWLVPGQIWQDGEGLWFSSRKLAELLKRPAGKMYRTLREEGIVAKYKRVPLGNGHGASTTLVHHYESEIAPLLGVGGPAGPTSHKRSAHKRPEEEKHKKWREWKDAGLSYNQIVERESDTTGENYSREAVVQALRRLK